MVQIENPSIFFKYCAQANTYTAQRTPTFLMFMVVVQAGGKLCKRKPFYFDYCHCSTFKSKVRL